MIEIEGILPHTLTERAYRASNGEWAWRREDAIEVVEALAAAGIAIHGGEVWAVRGIYICGLIPLASNGVPAVFGWSVVPGWWQRDRETWEAYCARCRGSALSGLSAQVAEQSCDPSFRPHLWYNLTFGGHPRG